jgi:hypothetical protein
VARFLTLGFFARLIDFGNGQVVGSDNIWLSVAGNLYGGFNTLGSQDLVGSAQFTDTTNFNVFCICVSNSSSGATGTLYVNNVATASTSITASANKTFTTPFIGKSQYAGDAVLNGQIRQIDMYNTTLSSTDLTSEYNNLKTKWSVHGSLVRSRYPIVDDGTTLITTAKFDAAFSVASTETLNMSSFTVPQESYYGLIYTGSIVVNVAGSYTFGVTSDDGSDMALQFPGSMAWDMVSVAYG